MVSFVIWKRSLDDRQRDEEETGGAEIWFYRRMLRIPWTARRTNQEVMQRAGVGRELTTVLMKRQVGILGHLLTGNGLEKDCLLGILEGRRASRSEI